MTGRRSFGLWTVGSLALVALLGLVGWLAALNLAKHDRLPGALEELPGVEAAQARAENESAAGEAGTDEASDQDAVLDDGVGDAADAVASDPSLLASDSPVPGGSGGDVGDDDDGWPGGRGPVPDGPPVPRQVLVGADGGVRVVGSAPDWSVVTDLVELVDRRLGSGSRGAVIDVTWHPEASSRADAVEVMLGQPLRYRVGEIALPDDGRTQLQPVVDVLSTRPGSYAVVVGEVSSSDAGDEESAVALARVTAVVDDLVAAGVEADRLLVVVAPAAADEAGDGDGAGAGVDGGERVLVRIENALLPAATG